MDVSEVVKRGVSIAEELGEDGCFEDYTSSWIGEAYLGDGEE